MDELYPQEADFERFTKVYFTKSYNNSKMIPVRCFLPDRRGKGEWREIDTSYLTLDRLLKKDLDNRLDAQDYFYRDTRVLDLNYNEVRYLPKVSDKDSDTCMWEMEFFEKNDLDDEESIRIVYGDILEKDETNKITMEFEYVSDESIGGYYKLSPNDNAPEEWDKIYTSSPIFLSIYTARDFLIYGALRLAYPDIMKKVNYQIRQDITGFDYVTVGDSVIISDNDRGDILAIRKQEDGNIVPGFQRDGEFTSFEDVIARKKEMENQNDAESARKKEIIELILQEKEDEKVLNAQLVEKKNKPIIQ